MSEQVQILSLEISAPEANGFEDKRATFYVRLPYDAQVFAVTQKPHGSVMLWFRASLGPTASEGRPFCYVLDSATIPTSWKFVGMVQRQVKTFLLYESA